jgi:hypothetical protein
MNPIKFDGHNKMLGAPPGWDEEKDGIVGLLPVYVDKGMFLSVWAPSDAERERIHSGFNIGLFCVGSQPPVNLVLTDAPGERMINKKKRVGKSVFQVLRELRDAHSAMFSTEDVLPDILKEADIILAYHEKEHS